VSGTIGPKPADIASQLRRDEGEVLSAYQDHLGYWTLGVGRLIDPRRGGGISAGESAYLLANDIGRIETLLDARLPWWRDLDDARRGVLVNMAFQLGVQGLLGFAATLALVQQRRWADAAAQMLQSKWAGQTPERAQRLARQMESGRWQ
jgi:lysozyme